MSIPQNPLSKYRSYSYHHILILCENSNVAEELDRINDASFFQRMTETGKTTQNKLEPQSAKSGQYIILINGMTDADFIIDDVTWMNITAAGVTEGDNNTSIATEGTMRITEPRGIRFMNLLSDAPKVLGVDPMAATWMLKTIFVGNAHDPVNGNYIDTIANIRPLLFVMYDVTGGFDIAGGNYTVSFVGVNNGAARLPQVARIAEGLKVNVEKEGNLLSSALKQLETRINEKYKEYFNCVEKTLKANPTTSNHEFRKVKYVIKTETDGYSDPHYKVTDIPKQTKTGTGPDGGGTIAFGKSPTVESAIHAIMRRSLEVKKDAKEGQGGIKYTYKIISTMLSEGDDLVVEYVVRRFKEPKQSELLKLAAANPNDLTDTDLAALAKNTIEFDYFYTGKNIDIISLDLKMEMGLAFFQTLASTSNISSYKQQLEHGVPPIALTAANNPGLKDGEVRTKTPIFPGTTLKDPMLRNSQDPNVTTSFQSAMAQHAGLESIETKVEITGNPYLLGNFNILPSEIVKTPTEREQRQGGNDEEQIASKWDSVPVLVKLNIRMPDSEYGGQFGTEPFWYQGYYYMFSVEHKFSGGEFKQTLDMVALPQGTTLEENDEDESGVLCKKYYETSAEVDKAEQPKSGQTAGNNVKLAQTPNE